MIVKIDKSVRQVETNDIRAYIADYENESNAGKATLDNIRRIISSFLAWLEDENYIVKSPARRIHKIRVSIQTNSLHGGMASELQAHRIAFPLWVFAFTLGFPTIFPTNALNPRKTPRYVIKRTKTRRISNPL